VSSATELAYRALTHQNPGRCRVEIHAPPQGPRIFVASDLAGHRGPDVVAAARVVAAVIQRELVAPGEDWLLVVRRPAGGHALVAFAESFGGWFNRPTFTPLAPHELVLVLAGTAPARHDP
jgi:hypothetical protein